MNEEEVEEEIPTYETGQLSFPLAGKPPALSFLLGKFWSQKSRGPKEKLWSFPEANAITNEKK